MIQTLSFQLNRIESTTYILFKNTLPIINVLKLLLYKETNVTGSFSEKKFRYSFDNEIWSDWELLNIVNITNILFNNNTNTEFYIEVIYYRNNLQSGNIQDFYLVYNTEYESEDYNGTINAIDNYINGVENIGSVFSEIKNNNGQLTAYLKNIVGQNHIIVSQDKETIYLSLDGNIDVSYQNDNIVTNPLGNITGDYFKDPKKFTDVMTDLFFPALDPILIDPSIYEFKSDKVLVPFDESTNLEFTTIFDRGSISYKDGSTNVYPRTGEIERYVYYYNNEIIQTVESDLSTNIINIPSVELPIGINEYKVDVYYGEGMQPTKSDGTLYGDPYPSGYITQTINVESVYRIYATINDVTDVQPVEELYSMIGGNNIKLTLAKEIDTVNRQSFEIPLLLMKNMENIKNVQLFNPLTQSYEDSLRNTWDNRTVVKNINGVNVSYVKFIYNGPKRGSVKINIVFNGQN